ncbi:MAG: acyl-CoA dehydrogenase [Candidatus Abyssobacteria bacterium SURF_17]|uniref:Acyl-CoA dehydrogenase n=1 Tax=Candidatus Abyssobacteria bacterium SURF_17 TaxID=2093361 RepID=A0A419EXE2_9BACT|nr:MAG: acyl-CoA dehydrogenase [Candidatus Abyssubacteria bacterium SURF_17]
MDISAIGLNISEEHRAAAETAHRFAMEVMRPAGITLDKMSDPRDVISRDSILWKVYKKHRELGFHKGAIPKAMGGIQEDVDALTAILVQEQLGYGDAGLAMSFGVSMMPFIIASIFAKPEIEGFVREYCEDTEGKMVGCWAFTEPDHGSDWILGAQPGFDQPQYAPSVRAIRNGDDYVLQGQKSSFISNGAIATHGAIYVSLDRSRGMKGTGIAFLPLDLPGVSRGKPMDKLGLRSYSQGEIIFEDVRIPEWMMLIPDSELALNISQTLFAAANGSLSLTFVGLAQAALDEALKYAKTRIQGGRPLIEHQSIKLKLFNMFTMVESARAYARQVALESAMQPPGSAKHSLSAKILATETAYHVASEAIQIHGGYGMSREFFIEKLFRDARVGMLGEENNSLALLGASYL